MMDWMPRFFNHKKYWSFFIQMQVFDVSSSLISAMAAFSWRRAAASCCAATAWFAFNSTDKNHLNFLYDYWNGRFYSKLTFWLFSLKKLGEYPPNLPVRFCMGLVMSALDHKTTKIVLQWLRCFRPGLRCWEASANTPPKWHQILTTTVYL